MTGKPERAWVALVAQARAIAAEIDGHAAEMERVGDAYGATKKREWAAEIGEYAANMAREHGVAPAEEKQDGG